MLNTENRKLKTEHRNPIAPVRIADRRIGLERRTATMRVSAHPVLERLMLIDSAVRRRAWPNARKLARQFEMTRRTIQRDIDFMRTRLGAPLEFDTVQNGYYYTDPNYRLSLFEATEGELVALLVSAQVMDHYRGTPFERDLRKASGQDLQESPRDDRDLPRRAELLPFGPAPRSNHLQSRHLSGSRDGGVPFPASEHDLLDRRPERNAATNR